MGSFGAGRRWLLLLPCLQVMGTEGSHRAGDSELPSKIWSPCSGPSSQDPGLLGQRLPAPVRGPRPV
jgi:hypothetical protein